MLFLFRQEGFGRVLNSGLLSFALKLPENV